MTDSRLLGQAYIGLGDLENAKLCYEKTLAIARKAFGNTHPEVAKFANNLGLLLLCMGQLESAESQLQEAVQLSETANGEQHFETATTLNDLGLSYCRTAQYEEACTQFERTVVLSESEHAVAASEHLPDCKSVRFIPPASGIA